jgi:hypothetical protein
MKTALGCKEIAELFSQQAEVWADTDHAHEILIDTCSAFAHMLELNDEDKKLFMEACGWTLIWGVAS